MYQLNLLDGEGQEITNVKHRNPLNKKLWVTVSSVGFTLDTDPTVYFPESIWRAGGVIAFDGGRGTRLLLTDPSN